MSAHILRIANYASYTPAVQKLPQFNNIVDAVEYTPSAGTYLRELKDAGIKFRISKARNGIDHGRASDGPYIRIEGAYPFPKDTPLHLVKPTQLEVLAPRMITIGIQELARMRDEAVAALKASQDNLKAALAEGKSKLRKTK